MLALGRILLPLAIFGAFAYLAPTLIFGNMRQTHLDLLLQPACLNESPPETTIFRLQYTGVQRLDDTLCTLVSFFQPTLNPTPLPILKYFFGTHGPFVLIPLVEGKRPGAWFPVRAPMVMWGVYQLFTIGAGSPWYWLGFVLLSNGVAKGHEKSALSRHDALEVVASFIVGSVLPFAAMMAFHNPWTTALWQIFPLIVWLSGLVFSFLIPKRKDDGITGSRIIVRVWWATFVVSALTHLKYAYSLELWNLSLQTLPTTSVREGADMFLKWDLLFGYATFLVGSCWLAGRRQEFVKLMVLHVLGSIVVGPAAVLAVSSIWREKDLAKSDRRNVKTQ